MDVVVATWEDGNQSECEDLSGPLASKVGIQSTDAYPEAHSLKLSTKLVKADVVVICSDGGPGYLATPERSAITPPNVFGPGELEAQLVILLVPDQRDLSVWASIAPRAVIAACTEGLYVPDAAEVVIGFIDSWKRRQMYSLDGWMMLWPADLYPIEPE